MSEAKHMLQTLALTRQDAQAELTDFIRTRTELECTIEDLRAVDANAGGKRAELERDLAQVEGKIAEREHTLSELLPEWEAQRTHESTEKRRLDETSAKLASLYAKQGRATKFRTKAERDTFLKHEIASMKTYQTTQNVALGAMRTELETARHGLGEIDEQIVGVQGKIEDGRKRVRDLAEESTRLKDRHSELAERRKDMWREDTKLTSIVTRAADELRTAERALAGMMDKVCLLVPIINIYSISPYRV
jgi:structural maintenance of chromosome 3 (chondroitin sulfate proteoglycan 6)